MKSFNKGVGVFMNALFLLILLYPNAARAKRVDIHFDQMRLSAELNNVPLETICYKISQERGIWFKAFVSLAKVHVSVQFKDLSMEAALKRILSATNYSLVFDETEAIIGVIIIDNKTSGVQRGKDRHIAVDNVIPFEEQGETPDFEKSSQALASDDQAQMETGDKVIGIAETVEDSPGLDLPVEVEMELANLEAMEKEALTEEVPFDTGEPNNEED